MKNRYRITKHHHRKKRQDWPLVVYLWIAGMAIFGYLFGRFALDAFPHPVHWSAGLVGGVLGIPVGWLWYRWRGDMA
jgi:CHASE2 domain-containing sensor protein